MSTTVLAIQSTSVALAYQYSVTPVPFATNAFSSSEFDRPLPDSRLTSSEQSARLLSDIPFICVGTLSLGVLILCLVTRRLKKPLIFILSSAFVAFCASIIDVKCALQSDSQAMFGLLVTRDMGYALSIGLRFLCLWIYVGGCTRSSASPSFSEEKERRRGPPPAGSWTRWGTGGLVVKYLTLLCCIAIIALQTVWRFGHLLSMAKLLSAYMTEAALEIFLSISFALILVTQAAFFRPEHQSPPLITVSVVFSLALGTGVGIGEMIVVRFSESILGRIFQAVLMSTLVIAFLMSTHVDAVVAGSVQDAHVLRMQKRSARTSSFQAVQIPSPFLDIQMPPLALQMPPERPSIRRRTTTERFSGWISGRLGLRPANDDDEQLWTGRIPTLGDAENPPYSAGLRSASEAHSINEPPQEEVSYVKRGSATPVVVPRPAKTASQTAADALPEFVTRGKASRSGNEAGSPSKRSSYGMDHTFRHTVGSVGTVFSYTETSKSNAMGGDASLSSPTYGLEGIIKKLMTRDTMTSQATSHFRNGGLSVPQQSQMPLESPVRLPYSATSTAPSAYPPITPSPSQPSISLPLKRRPSTGRTQRSPLTGADSLSVRSEFTLSNFPSPPAALKSFLTEGGSSQSDTGTPSEWDDTASFVPRRATMEEAPLTIRDEAPPERAAKPEEEAAPTSTAAIEFGNSSFILVPPKMPAALSEARDRKHSFPSTTRGSDVSGLFGPPSAREQGLQVGTGHRIDVTSFIKGLSRPDGVPLSAVSHKRDGSDKTILTDGSHATTVTIGGGRRSNDSPTIDAHAEAAIISEVRRGNSLKARLVVPSPLGSAQSSPLPAPSNASSSQSSSRAPTTIPGIPTMSALPTTPRPTGAGNAHLRGQRDAFSAPASAGASTSKPSGRHRPTPLQLPGKPRKGGE